jgi:hypothetical protein
MTALLKASDVQMAGGLEYAPRHRKVQPTHLPQPLPCVTKQSLARVPFGQMKGHVALNKMLDTYKASQTDLSGLATDANKFFRNVAASNIEVRCDPTKKKEVMLAKYRALEETIPTVTTDPPDVIDFDFAALAPLEKWKALGQALVATAQNLVENIFRALDTMQENRLIGLVQQHPNNPAAFRFDYHRSIVDERQSESVRAEEIIKRETAFEGFWQKDTKTFQHKLITERKFERSHRNARITHIIHNGRLTDINVRIRKPPFVETFLKSVPCSLAPYLQIVHGDMIREERVEITTGVEKWTERDEESLLLLDRTETTYKWDPGVCLGHWCLMGWSDSDL